MAETTAQLQAKLMALTNGKVDIMASADEFKSTTQILREMAAVWEDMTDVQQAAALELLGGKRQGNILSSLLTNFETVEDVIETSTNSTGSAMAENEKWLDSIEGKTYQFTNALQNMWRNLIDSKVVKSFIDFGTDVVNFLDTGAGKAIAFAAAMKMLMKFKGISLGSIYKGLQTSAQQINQMQFKLDILPKADSTNIDYVTTNIQSYANAVAGLTPKLQAQKLASQGLNAEQIKLALSANGADEATIRLATSTLKSNSEIQRSVVLKKEEIANLIQANSAKLSTTAQNFLLAHSEQEINEELLEQAVIKGVISAKDKQQLMSTLGLTGANYGLAGSFKAAGIAMKTMMMSNPVGFFMTLATTVFSVISIFDMFGESAEEAAQKARQAAEEIKSAYQQESGEIGGNIDALRGLRDEFDRLSKCVDDYGNNVSLSADDYERYKEIVETIVGISPSLIDGYNSEGEAIANKNGLLQKSIDLMEEEQRLKAKEYVSKDNVSKLISGAKTDLPKLNTDNDEFMRKLTQLSARKVGDDGAYVQQLDHYISEAIGVTFNKDGIGKYIVDNIELIEEHLPEILHNASESFTDSRGTWEPLTDKQLAIFEDMLVETINAYNDYESEITSMLMIAAQSSDAYYDLDDQMRGFLSNYVRSIDATKITSADSFETIKEDIVDFTEFLTRNDVQQHMSDGYKLKLGQDQKGNRLNYKEYQDKIREFIKNINDADYTDNQKQSVFNLLGLDTESNEFDNNIKNAVDHAKNLLQDQFDEKVDDLSISDILITTKITEDPNSLTFGELSQKILEIKSAAGIDVVSVKTHSALTESIEMYNDIMHQTSEIMHDNTEVTQEYKASLIALGLSQEDINACFYENNPLIVKNAKALNQLIKSSNKNIAANVKLAKSNARLEYYNLVKQLGATINSEQAHINTITDSIRSTLEQIDAVERAIYQYQLLEDTLLGVNNAFKEFNEAKEIDDLNTYGDSYVEMVQTMYDALFKTGKVGTEQFWTAVEHLVPDEVYQGLKEDSDRMKAIYDYYNKNILPSLHLDEDQFSMDYDSIENFVNKGLKSGVFSGNKEDFDLVEGMNLEKAADLMGMTKTQAYAFFAELDKYNSSSTEPSFLEQLDDSLEGKITSVTNKVEDLNRQKLELLKDGGYDKHKDEIDAINKQLEESGSTLEDLGKQAYESWEQYTQNDAAIASLEQVTDKTKKLDEVWPEDLITSLHLDGNQTVQEAYDHLLLQQLLLEKPTILTAQLAIDNIDSQITALETAINNNDFSGVDPVSLGLSVDATSEEIKAAIQAKISSLKDDKAVIATTFGIELSEEDKMSLQEELAAIEEYTIGDKEFKVIVNGTSETLQVLRNINDYTIGNKTYTVTTKYQDVGNNTTRTTGSGGRYTRVDGTAHANGSWGAPKTETALVGELGPEMLVRNGRWTTIGDKGAEFTQVKKGDIIFNHKQTEDLLSKGYVTGRGKLHGGAFASGTAYSGTWRPTSPGTEQSNKPGNDFSSAGQSLYNAADALKSASDYLSGSSDEFKEVFDWIEVKLEEINEEIDLRSAQLENKVGYKAQNDVVDKIITLNKSLKTNLDAAKGYYETYASKLLSKVDSQYKDLAQNGAIDIDVFKGEIGEKQLEAIKEYREWVQKGADVTQQAEETITEISSLAKQAIDNIATQFDNESSLRENKSDQLEAYNALLETTYGTESGAIYKALIDINKTNIKELEKQRDAMQKELNTQVEAGNIKKYSQDWYDAINDIAALDTEIIELTTDINDFQDSINEIHWYHFDLLTSQFEAVSEEAENLIDILATKDVVDEMGNWTDEGITALGLYAQQMEIAEKQAAQYAKEIEYLNNNWETLGYTEEEYLEKLEDLKDGQYDAIKAYNDSKDAIVDLNKERVDAIKEGIEKEIEAYEELIDKKKEELDAEQDLFDFQKSIQESSKNIADLERQLAALSADNSASARAKRAQLEAELAEAKQELEDQYYDRSVSNKQEALDKELENYKDEKDAEMEALDKYLEDTEKVVSDSLATIQANTDTVYQTLSAMGQEYSLSITESLTSPWEEGKLAIQSFSEQFGISMSATVEELNQLEQEFAQTISAIDNLGSEASSTVSDNANKYTSAEYKEPPKTETSGSSGTTNTSSTSGMVSSLSGTIAYGQSGSKVKALQTALNALGYNCGNVDGKFGPKTLAAVKKFQKAMGIKQDGKVGPKTKEKFKLKGYAVGSTGIDEDQWAILDELGDELQLVPGENGRLAYVKKGTGIVPADMTERLMNIAMDPQAMLDQNRPSVGLHPEIHNNQIVIDNSVGELIHIDKCDQSTLPDVEKIVNKAVDNRIQSLNQSLRKFVR